MSSSRNQALMVRKSSQERMRAEARRLWGEPLEEDPGDRVRLVTLFSSKDLQRDYRGYTIVYDGKKFRKLVKGLGMTLVPSRKELIRFLRDLEDAVETDKEVSDFIERNPPPIRLLRRKR